MTLRSFASILGSHLCWPALLAGSTIALDCDRTESRSVKISGSGSSYEVRGQCRRVEIDGYQNRIRIEQSDQVEVDGARNGIRIGQVGRLEIDGLENEICYEKLSGKMENAGLRNQVAVRPDCLGEQPAAAAERAPAPARSPAAPAPAPSPAPAQAAAPAPEKPAPPPPPARKTWGKECAETGKLRVTGLGSNVRVLGPCAEVEVSGTGNRVEVHDVEKVVITGTGNQIEVHRAAGGRRARIVDRGIGNNVTEK